MSCNYPIRICLLFLALFTELLAELPSSGELLSKIDDYYSQADSIEVDVGLEMNFNMGGEVHASSSTANFRFKRPNFLSIHSTSDEGSHRMVSNEAKTLVYYNESKQYMEGDPIDFSQLEQEGAVSNVAGQFVLGNVMSYPVFGMILMGSFDSFSDGASDSSVVESQFEGLETYTIETELQGVGVFQMSVPRSGPAHVLQCVIKIDMKGEAGEVNQMEMVSSYRNWQIDQVMDAEGFTFELPEGAEEMDLELDYSDVAAEPPHSLLGSTAPATTLTLLDGTEADLSQHLDSEIVILDFWATWCPPCVRAMPDLNTLAEEYAGKDLAVYVVNQGESTKQIEAFLKKNELSLAAALDDGTVGDLYAVSAIPQTVIIGKDGRVHSVHVGYSSTYLEELRSDVAALLLGEDLAAEKISQFEASAGTYVAEDIYQGKPIPAGEDTITWSKVTEQANAVFKRQVLAATEQAYLGKPAAIQEVSQLVRNFADKLRRSYLIQHQYALLQKKECLSMIKQIQSLKKQHGASPVLFLTELELLEISNGNAARKRAVAQKGLKSLSGANWNPYFKYKFSHALAETSAGAETKQKFADRLPALVAEMVAESHYDEGEELVVMRRFVDYWNNVADSEKRAIADILCNFETLPEYVAAYVDGDAYIAQAWDARGGGYANTVTDEGWVTFGEYIEKARAVLMPSWEKYPQLPQAAQRMITVSMAASESPNEERLWFDRSVAAQMDYSAAYRSLVWAMRPRWGGSHRAMFDFAQECLDSGRFDTTVPLQYLMICRDICRDQKAGYAFFQREEVRPGFSDLANGYLHDANSIVFGRDAAELLFAATYVHAGYYQQAHALLAAQDYTFNWAKLSYYSRIFNKDNFYFIMLAARYGSVIVDDVKRAEAIASSDPAQATAIYQDLLGREDLSPVQKDTLIDSIELLKNQGLAQFDDWVTYFEPGADVAWVGDDLSWQVDDAGSLQYTGYDQWDWLPFEFDFKQGFELEVVLEIPAESKVRGPAILFFGVPGRTYLENVEIWVRPDRQYLIMTTHQSGEYIKLPLKDTETYSLKLKVEDLRLSLSVNGERVIEERQLSDSKQYAQALRFGLGDMWTGVAMKHVRVKLIRAKPLRF